jgi:hypothetical protein
MKASGVEVDVQSAHLTPTTTPSPADPTTSSTAGEADVHVSGNLLSASIGGNPIYFALGVVGALFIGAVLLGWRHAKVDEKNRKHGEKKADEAADQLYEDTRATDPHPLQDQRNTAPTELAERQVEEEEYDLERSTNSSANAPVDIHLQLGGIRNDEQDKDFSGAAVEPAAPATSGGGVVSFFRRVFRGVLCNQCNDDEEQPELHLAPGVDPGVVFSIASTEVRKNDSRDSRQSVSTADSSGAFHSS